MNFVVEMGIWRLQYQNWKMEMKDDGAPKQDGRMKGGGAPEQNR